MFIHLSPQVRNINKDVSFTLATTLAMHNVPNDPLSTFKLSLVKND